MTGTADQTSHYDCHITKNGGKVFCARFQKVQDAINFKKRNKIVSVDEVVNRYYYAQGANHE